MQRRPVKSRWADSMWEPHGVLVDPGGATRLLREAANFGVSVNAIAAGIFDTDLGNTLPEKLLQMHDFWVAKGRSGRPAELAEIAAFMTSDRNSFMSGEIVIVDGGAVT